MQPYFYHLANKLALMELETALSPQKTFLIGAFANAIALCDEADESPLGPIKVVLHSKNIEDVIDWLVSDAE